MSKLLNGCKLVTIRKFSLAKLNFRHTRLFINVYINNNNKYENFFSGNLSYS